jgi:hypothetical protein
MSLTRHHALLLKSTITAAFCVLMLAAPNIATAQEKPPEGLSPQEHAKLKQEHALLQTARKHAALAGGARFCKLDKDDIEEFISKADARLALLARDDYQKVLGRLEFKNLLAATSARAPDNGCAQLKIRFDTILRESR